MSSEDEKKTSPEEYFFVRRLAQERDKCPDCGSTNIRKSDEDCEGEFFECLDCGAEWKRTWDGTMF